MFGIEGMDGRKRIASEWKKFSSKEFGITNSMIARPTRIVLNDLKRKCVVLFGIICWYKGFHLNFEGQNVCFSYFKVN